MGWWRSLLPCCGPKSLPPAVATFCCCCCNAKEGMHDEATQRQQKEENGEDNFVFLENYATDQKIVNPVVPFLGELPSLLYPGRMLLLQGFVHPHAIRMSVNLACGSGPTSDLAFHLNPRFEQNLVVRNYRIDSRWGKEETSSPKRFPFKRGHQFQMQIFITEEEFLVAFNGEHFCAFTFRLPLEHVQIIQVNGDMDVSELEYKSADAYPLPYEGAISPKYKISAAMSLNSTTKDLIDPPFVAELQEGLSIGSELEVVGRVKLLPHSFFINLQKGTQIWPHPPIALHINPRFRANGGVIQNAWVKGKWGAEVLSEIHQFRAGRPFTIKISCEPERYAVSVDGATPLYFDHRCSPDIVNAIRIQGDIWIKDIRYAKTVAIVKSVANVKSVPNVKSFGNVKSLANLKSFAKSSGGAKGTGNVKS